MKLTAKASMEYAKRRLRPGDAFDASTRDARVLVLIGKAKYAETEAEADVDAEATEQVVEPRTTSRRQYRRRDLQAQA